MIRNCNDGTKRAPYLRLDFSYSLLTDLPEFSTAPKGDERARHEAIKAAGYAGIQGGNPKVCRELGLGFSSGARVNEPKDVREKVAPLADQGYECCTLHVGWGMESPEKVAALIETILATSAELNFPLYIETHRATITQDIWRTVEFVKSYPDLRFNGDFSHYYTGLEMPYGGMENKLAFLAPIFERVRFMQARIGNAACIQVDVGDGRGRPYVDHHVEMWTRSFMGFLRTAQPGDYMSFTPELLGPSAYYARQFPGADGVLREEGDRWAQSLVYLGLAREAFAEAQRRLTKENLAQRRGDQEAD